MKKIITQGLQIYTFQQNENDYISLTDIARYKDSERTDYLIQNWMRTRDTIEFLGIWEQINNPNFKGVEFDAFKNTKTLLTSHFRWCTIIVYYEKQDRIKNQPDNFFGKSIALFQYGQFKRGGKKPKLS